MTDDTLGAARSLVRAIAVLDNSGRRGAALSLTKRRATRQELFPKIAFLRADPVLDFQKPSECLVAYGSFATDLLQEKEFAVQCIASGQLVKS